MNILHIHSSDHQGGGGGTVAMERLHLGLRARGINSRVMAGRKTSPSPYTRALPRRGITNAAERLAGKVTKELGLNDLNYISSFLGRHADFYKQADLIHFHGTHGFFNYLALPYLSAIKPALFTLHDMWAMTGHCSQSLGCDRWQSGCGQCPHPDAHPAIKRDNTALEWKLKRWAYDRSNLQFVAVSRWLAGMGERGLLGPHTVHFIPNGVDTRQYEPMDAQMCRQTLGIGDARYVIIFVALSLGDKNKGGDVVAHALTSLPEAMKQDTCLIVLGDGGDRIQDQVGIRTLNLGYVRNDRLKAIAYSAANVMLFPTRAEAFGLVIAEAMACGTPALSSSRTAVPELVIDGTTGRTANPDIPDDFARLLVEMLEDTAATEAMAHAGRAHIVANYDLDQVVADHITLYQQTLQESPSGASDTTQSINIQAQ